MIPRVAVVLLLAGACLAQGTAVRMDQVAQSFVARPEKVQYETVSPVQVPTFVVPLQVPRLSPSKSTSTIGTGLDGATPSLLPIGRSGNVSTRGCWATAISTRRR